MKFTYSEIKKILAHLPLPCMLVDLDTLQTNAQNIFKKVRANNHSPLLRIATKSIRVPDLIKKIYDWGQPVTQGLMCFSAAEAAYLATLGFDDLLIAYPTVQESDLKIILAMLAANKLVHLMVDDIEQLNQIEKFLLNHPTSKKINLCIDVDVSLRLLDGKIHLGVRRSPIHHLQQFKLLAHTILNSANFNLSGVMAYEAQIAGLGDNYPYKAWQNPFKKFIRKKSISSVAKQREAIANWLEQEKIKLQFFNGGGTGSLNSTIQEPWLSEVTAGSGFLQSHLFDYYQENQNQPALFFALPVTRKPAKNILTCQSGGFIASGPIGLEKNPLPYLPEGMKVLSQEGFGEVQTPLYNTQNIPIQIGDPILFRPAKSGEIAEHFNEYILISKNVIVGSANTYRGLGLNYF